MSILTLVFFETYRLDMQESPDAYRVRIDLPGYSKDQINVSVDNGVLLINGSKTSEVDEPFLKEKKSSTVRRSVRLPEDAKSEPGDFTAKMLNGQLTLDFPRIPTAATSNLLEGTPSSQTRGKRITIQ